MVKNCTKSGFYAIFDGIFAQKLHVSKIVTIFVTLFEQEGSQVCLWQTHPNQKISSILDEFFQELSSKSLEKVDFG